MTENLTKERPDAVSGCLELLLGLAEELGAFRQPLSQIHQVATEHTLQTAS